MDPEKQNLLKDWSDGNQGTSESNEKQDDGEGQDKHKTDEGDKTQKETGSDAARHNGTCRKSTARRHVRARAVNVR
jgi:hypothetical protein